jgi:hypothetical protein
VPASRAGGPVAPAAFEDVFSPSDVRQRRGQHAVQHGWPGWCRWRRSQPDLEDLLGGLFGGAAGGGRLRRCPWRRGGDPFGVRRPRGPARAPGRPGPHDAELPSMPSQGATVTLSTPEGA